MKDQPFEPKSLNILALFTDSDARYQIPSYQRHYKWEDEHVDKLWDDLTESWENTPEGNYFLGSIITSKPETQTRYVDVVDGQQRLTTLIILFCVIRDLYPDLNKNSENEYAITSNTVKEAIKSGQDGRERFLLQQRFLPGDSSKTDFENSIIAEGATKDLKRPTKSEMSNDNPKHKFINSAVILRENLKRLGKEQTEIFISYLFNNVQVIRIDCKDISFAIKLFQVINTRGLDLSPADLIKSFLFGKISSPDKGLLESTKRQFMNDWSATETMASDSYETMVDMLTLYLYYTRADNPKRSLFEELSQQFEKQFNDGEAPTQILGNIKGFVEDYKTKLHERDDKVIYSFWYLPWQTHWKSILLTALQENYSGYENLAKELRRFYYLHWIAGKTLTRIKQSSFNVIKKTKDGEPLDNIVKMLRDKTEEGNIIADALYQLDSSNMAEQRWAKPLLLLLEYAAKDNSTLSFVNWDNKLHLEHIFPQNPYKSGWGHINKDIAKQYLNSAGNITLLSGKKNINASNKSFAEKIKAYKGKGLESSDPGVTSFAITQEIVSAYEGNAYGKQWTEAAMRDRKKWFLEETAKLLDIEKEMAAYKPDS